MGYRRITDKWIGSQCTTVYRCVEAICAEAQNVTDTIPLNYTKKAGMSKHDNNYTKNSCWSITTNNHIKLSVLHHWIVCNCIITRFENKIQLIKNFANHVVLVPTRWIMFNLTTLRLFGKFRSLGTKSLQRQKKICVIIQPFHI